MLEAIEYKKIIEIVNKEFENQPIRAVFLDSVSSVSQNAMSEINKKIKKHTTVGILFCRPEIDFVKKEILSSLNYLHHRSGDNINFFCCGYGAYWPDKSNVVTTIDSVDWLFSDKKFVNLIEEFESKTNWQYSGETDFLLLDIVPSNDNTLNIQNALVCNLEQMQKDNAFSSVRSFFENLIRFYASSENKSTLAYSDIQGINKGLEFLKDSILNHLPLDLGKLYRSAGNYVVRDITKK